MAPLIYLVGCGGHGKSVLEALLSQGLVVHGILDAQRTPGEKILGVSVVGDDRELDRFDVADTFLLNGLGANPNITNRKKLFLSMKSKGFSFHLAQHVSAVVGRECAIGEGSQILAGVVLQSNVRIAENVVINSRASIDHDCQVSAHAFVSPGAILCGHVMVGEGAFIGAGAIILPDVNVGAGSIIGAGAVVTRNVAPGWTVVGNPARQIGASQS